MSRISWGIDRVVMWLLAALMAVETAIVFSAVVSRYFFNYSFAWSDEVARGLLTWIIFLGATAAYRRQELVEIPFFKDMLPKIALRIVLIVSAVAVAIFLIYTIRYGINLLTRTSRQVTPVLGISLYYFSGAVVVGSAVMLLHVASDLLSLLLGKEIVQREFVEDTVPSAGEAGRT